MISVHREWTLKWPPSPPPPSFLRALIKWGSPPHSISPMASCLPSLPVVPCILAIATQICLFPGVEKGEKTGEEGDQDDSQGFPLPSFMALKQPGGAPKGHCSEHPRHSSLCPLTQATQTPMRHLEIQNLSSPSLFTSPLSPVPIF